MTRVSRHLSLSVLLAVLAHAVAPARVLSGPPTIRRDLLLFALMVAVSLVTGRLSARAHALGRQLLDTLDAEWSAPLKGAGDSESPGGVR